MTAPTPEEIEWLATEIEQDFRLFSTKRAKIATALRSLATLQRERDEARRMLAEADTEAARLRENARAAKRRLASHKEPQG